MTRNDQTDSSRLLPNIAAGFIIGLLQILLALSFAALIFSGSLTPHLAQGIGMALAGMIITGLVIAGFTSLPGAIGGSQGVPAAIMAIMAAAIAGSGGSSTESLVTVAAAIAATTILTGIFFWVLGQFRLGGLVRFLPYPVVGGFLAGVGWLLVTGAVAVMVKQPLGFNDVWLLFQPEILVYWLPGFILAVVMLVAMRRGRHVLILPMFLVGALLLFFVVAWLSGKSLAEWGAEGWLLGPFAEGSTLWRPFGPGDLRMVNWQAIVDQLANIIAIMTVSAMSLLLNAGGLELATGRDLEVNRELKVAGAANMAAGLAAGFVGYKQLSLSTLNFKLGGNSRLPGLIAAAACFLVLLAGGSFLSYFPTVVVGALLLLLGLDFLLDWVVVGFFRLPKIDYAITLVILFVTMAAGFLEAVALGLLMAVVMFVVSYSRIEVVRHQLSRNSYKSRVTRPRAHEQILMDRGEQLHILQLQGFIFFGTASNLLNQLRWRVNDPDQIKPTSIVLDFQRVTGLDSTAMLSFTRMKQLAENEDITLVFASPNKRVLQQLQQGGLGDNGSTVRVVQSLDQGVELCENQLLQLAGVAEDDPPSPLAQQFQEILDAGVDTPGQKAGLQALLDHMKVLEVAAGEILLTMGDEPDDIYFVDSGLVTAQIERQGQLPVRLETSGTGSVIGEIGFYLGQKRTADVIAEAPSTLYHLSIADLQHMEETDPEAASVLHQIMVHLLAERLIRLTNALKALES